LRQVIIAGEAGAADTEALLDAAQASFAPDKAVIFIDPADQEAVDFWRGHNPEALAMVEGAGLQVRELLVLALVPPQLTCECMHALRTNTHQSLASHSLHALLAT
jgi:hypothetical protein